MDEIKRAELYLILDELQQAAFAWQIRNFGRQPTDYSLMGLVEEVGELSHAHLKGLQGIRHTLEEIEQMKFDAVGDILIYLMNYCEGEEISMGQALIETWEKVSKRDWKANPIGADEVTVERDA